MFDLFRFGWKYTPFVPSEFVYATEEPLSFLVDQPGHFRVERERGGILPPNTWGAYGLKSVSGYDPLATGAYVSFYEESINRLSEGRSSRYSELEVYDARLLGDLGVKYLLGLRWSDEGEIVSEGDGHNYRISTDDWEPVRYDGGVVLFENKYFRPMVRFEVGEGVVDLSTYRPGFIEADYEADGPGDIVVAESAYPGWNAYLDNEPVSVGVYKEVFKSVPVEAGSGVLKLEYEPLSFREGMKISLLSLVLWLLLVRATNRQGSSRA